MKIVLASVGRLRPPFADDVAHYERLLRPRARIELIEVRDDGALARRIPDRAFKVLLAADGRSLESEAFAEFLEGRRQSGQDLCFVIGGAMGTEVVDVDMRLTLGPLTLPHQLARVVLLEQIFRAHKIIAGERYHY